MSAVIGQRRRTTVTRRPRPRRPRTSITARRTAGGAGCSRPTTRTSARCTCCSASRCSWSAACWRWASAPSCSSRACSSSTRELFNQFTTMHGLIMVFGAIMPAFVGFANWMVPLQIGAPDMAFARMNNLSFWLLIPAALHARRLVLHARRRAGRRLDALRAADAADGPVDGRRRSSRCTSWARARSWARSTSSSRSSTCARPA